MSTAEYWDIIALATAYVPRPEGERRPTGNILFVAGWSSHTS
jgi:hypothetical protein